MDGKKLGARIKKLFYKYWFILVILITLFLRLPSLFEPFTYGDEGIYLTLGQALRKGLILYRDIHDNKPPLLYLLAAVAGEFSRFRLILFVWSFATIFMFYKLSFVLFPKNKLSPIISTALFSFLSSIHSFEGNVANAENFMLLPTILGFWLILKKSGQKKYWLLAGALFSLATLFKFPAAFDFTAALAFVFLTTKIKKFLFQASNLVIGFILPVLATILYFASQNALNQYLKAAFFQNLPYLSSWTQDKIQAGGLPLALLSRGLLVFLLFLFIFIFRKKFSPQVKLILTWFSFSLFAALLSARPYPHYLLQILPPLSLSVGMFYCHREKLIPGVLIMVLVATFIIFKFWYYPNLPYLFNYYAYLVKFKNQDQYFKFFDPQTEAIYQAAVYIKTHTSPSEKIFVWGNQPAIYALSGRLPVGRYTVAYHIKDYHGYQETIKALLNNPPRYLVILDEYRQSFPDLAIFIERNYLPQIQFNQIQIFHKIYGKIRNQ